MYSLTISDNNKIEEESGNEFTNLFKIKTISLDEIMEIMRFLDKHPVEGDLYFFIQKEDKGTL